MALLPPNAGALAGAPAAVWEALLQRRRPHTVQRALATGPPPKLRGLAIGCEQQWVALEWLLRRAVSKQPQARAVEEGA